LLAFVPFKIIGFLLLFVVIFPGLFQAIGVSELCITFVVGARSYYFGVIVDY